MSPIGETVPPVHTTLWFVDLYLPNIINLNKMAL